MVLQIKVETVNFWKSQQISLLWLDCFITKFRNKRRDGANRSPLGRIGLTEFVLYNYMFFCTRARRTYFAEAFQAVLLIDFEAFEK